jgi:ferredoxin
VGVAELREGHLYSHVGRGDDYGQRVELKHRFAIAFTYEMDHEMVARAPMAPTTMESARCYLDTGAIAVQVAMLLRNLGHAARAHIDGNYRVVCPLVAHDAGLGEIGRMGLLMTPALGPRVRIGVVSTEMPLVVSPRHHDPSVEEFCGVCDRCVVMCPAKAISRDKRDVDGELRWQIDSEACFTYWCRIGTDCARCMSVCPQAHPDTPFHRAVRWGVRRSRLFRRVAARADEWVYGPRPAPKQLAAWMNAGQPAVRFRGAPPDDG